MGSEWQLKADGDVESSPTLGIERKRGGHCGSEPQMGGRDEGAVEVPRKLDGVELNARIAGLRARIEQHFEDLEKR